MKKLTLITTGISFVLSITCFFTACKKDDSTTPPPPVNPVISNIVPMQDTVGAQITINGSGFSTTASDDVVKFGAVTATVLSATTTKLIVTVPSGAQNAAISVSVDGNMTASTNSFTVAGTTPPPSISGFSPAIIGIGYPVTITGTNFNADSTKNIVTFNGVVAKLISSSTTQLVATVPLTAITGKISVSVNNQSAISATNITIKTLTVTTLAGGLPGQFSNGTGSGANFYGPWGIAGDGNGNYFVGDMANNLIRKVTSAGVVSTFAGTGMMGTLNGPYDSATFGNPFGVAFDSHGNLFVTCGAQNNIREISPAGFVTTFAGDYNGTAGWVDAAGTLARFNWPLGIAIDKNDNVFVMEVNNNRIRKITPAGAVSTFAGDGTGGSTDATGTAASFNSAWGLGIDANNNLYVPDAGNNKIRKVTPTGVVTTLAGTGTGGSTDGPALSATFNMPMGIVSDAAGNFYVSDMANQKIRMITADGTVVTLAGNGTQASVDGVGGFASFSSPSGMAIDGNGVIYLIDNYSGMVRKLVIE
jgi:hypothetical protein